jgi:hypothetical protein
MKQDFGSPSCMNDKLNPASANLGGAFVHAGYHRHDWTIFYTMISLMSTFPPLYLALVSTLYC